MERELLVWLRSSSSATWDQVFLVSHHLGRLPAVLSLVGAMGIWLCLRRAWRKLAAWCGVVAACALIYDLLPPLLARERPDPEAAALHATGWSLPSGHALVSAALFPTAARFLADAAPRHSRALALSAFVLVGYVGVGRVWLGVHWPSDVLAGWALGLGLSWLALRAAGDAGTRGRGGARARKDGVTDT